MPRKALCQHERERVPQMRRPANGVPIVILRSQVSKVTNRLSVSVFICSLADRNQGYATLRGGLLRLIEEQACRHVGLMT
jgi:hypothetical protein